VKVKGKLVVCGESGSAKGEKGSDVSEACVRGFPFARETINQENIVSRGLMAQICFKAGELESGFYSRNLDFISSSLGVRRR